MKKAATFACLLTGILLFMLYSSAGAEVRDYAVEINAAAYEHPPHIEFTWRGDPNAQQYCVFRKAESEEIWGPAITVLNGDATGYIDYDVEVGQAYEYSFRKTPTFISENLQVSPGTEVTFTIFDSYGDGICCQHGLGFYEVKSGGTIYAAGGEFGAYEETSFIVGDDGEMVVFIMFDAFPPETSWTLKENFSGETLAEGGPYDSPKYGHVFAGIRYPAIEYRGSALLLIEEAVSTQMPGPIERLEKDMIADGFRVERRIVTAGMTVPDVKALIMAACQDNPGIETLFLLGDIPTPYSGNLLGVHGNHQGAWPADLYYGDLDGEWTDFEVNNTTAFWPENHNVPGDGKFDQTFLPSEVELQVGRVDLSDMPAFSGDEFDLLRQYLDRNTAFRRAEVATIKRGLIDDNVGEYYGLAFAAFGWRNFTALCGSGAVFELDYFSTLEQENYLWSYGCGGGSNTSCAGVGTTWDFAEKNVQTVFTCLYGSYFGDWDKPNNFLRAPLASNGLALASFWANRPSWHLHHMALGRTIGYSTRLSQNNNYEYTVSDGQRQIYIALMGDPTLKMHVVAPPSGLQAHPENNGVRLTWAPSPDAGQGYYIYRASSIYDSFERINDQPAENASYFDPDPLPGRNVYMVRSLKLETSAGGTFYNLSAGIFAEMTPIPTPTPAVTHPTGVRLEISGDYVHPGEEFQLKGYLDNDGTFMPQVPVFFILDIYRNYFFWPSWTLYDPPGRPDIDFQVLDIPPGTSTLNVISPFVWPDTGTESLTGLFFHGAMLNETLDSIVGHYASVEWGYGPF